MDSEISISGYTFFHQDRSRHSGGVAIYVHNRLSAVLIPHGNPDIELILIKVSINSRSFVTGCYYRSPNSPESLMYLYHTLQSLNLLLLQRMTLLSDFNVNMLAPSHPLRPMMRIVLDSLNLHQIINSPTHFTSSNAGSLLDMILIYDPSLIL